MCDALVRHGSEYTIVRWIRATLEGRMAVATLNDISLSFAISRGALREVCVATPVMPGSK